MLKKALFRMNGVLIILFSLISVFVRAQNPGNLILIDAETKQPFTVRIGDQLFASSGHGHLVITHLQDSNYKLNIRFQKQNTGEQVFPVTIKGKDLGFQIKKSDSSWVLYNWQNKETINEVREIDSAHVLEQGVKREDGFSSLMAAVVNDSSVMYNTYTGAGFSGRDSAKSIKADSVKLKSLAANKAKTDSTAVKTATAAELPKTTATVAAIVEPKAKPFKPGIKKVREVSLKISRKIVYTDIAKDGSVDTVTLFVYFENSKSDTAANGQRPTANDKLPTANSQQPTANSQQPTETGQLPTANVTLPNANDQQCAQTATDMDLAALRTAILEANTDQEKIAVASGAFALKCFSVAQIRVLAGLLVSEKARYKLMDASHLHVSDHDQFRELVDMFNEKNMQKKFLLLAAKQS